MAVVVTELIRFPITLARQAINFPYERRWQAHTWQQTREAERLVRHFARRPHTVLPKIDPLWLQTQQQQHWWLCALEVDAMDQSGNNLVCSVMAMARFIFCFQKIKEAKQDLRFQEENIDIFDSYPKKVSALGLVYLTV